MPRRSESGHRPCHRWTLAAVTLSGALGLLVPSFTFGDAPNTGAEIRLFTDLSPPSTPHPPFAQAVPSRKALKRWIRRHKTVAVDPAARGRLSQPGGQEPEAMTIDLFDGVAHTADLYPTLVGATGTITWRGRFRGEPNSDVSLASLGIVVAGTIVSDNRLYRIELDEEGQHQLVEIDTEALPPDHHPLVVHDDAKEAALPPPTSNEPAPQTALADDGSVVDVLVVYTTTAKDREGGQAAIEALIALGVDQANQAYINSHINTQLRLVGVAEVVYTESGVIDTDLSRLRGTNDGFMDQVHQLRDQVQADLVAMIVEDGGGFCGIAYVMANGPRASFASSAFSVTARDCIANDTFAHELGHNMGNAHDRATGGTGVFAYSYGYRDEIGRFRTIMAYPCPTVSCPRVRYFSNPRLTLNGRPLGIDYAVDPANSADNSRSMNEVRQTVANWRTSDSDRTPPAAPANLRLLSP